MISGTWCVTCPPNETPVEVELDGEIIVVEAIYGRDGWRPHWRSKDGTRWDVPTFRRWRPLVDADAAIAKAMGKGE